MTMPRLGYVLSLGIGLTAAVAIAACGDDGTTSATGAGGSGGSAAMTGTGGASGTGGAVGQGGSSAELQLAQAQVFSGCSGIGLMHCHSSAPFDGNLDLTEGHAWASLVNQDATQSPGKKLVVPGDVNASFLMQKLTNDLATDGSEGVPMPNGEAIMWQELPPEKLAAVEAWIQAGAPP